MDVKTDTLFVSDVYFLKIIPLHFVSEKNCTFLLC